MYKKRSLLCSRGVEKGLKRVSSPLVLKDWFPTSEEGQNTICSDSLFFCHQGSSGVAALLKQGYLRQLCGKVSACVSLLHINEVPVRS